MTWSRPTTRSWTTRSKLGGSARRRERGRTRLVTSVAKGPCLAACPLYASWPTTEATARRILGTIRVLVAGSVVTPNVFAKDRSMSARSLNWLKFGGLVALAFALGLLFAGLLDLPNRSSGPGAGAGSQALGHRPGAGARRFPAARAAAGAERGLRRRGRARPAERRLTSAPSETEHASRSSRDSPGHGAVLLAPVPPAARDRAGQRVRASSSRPTATS